jgi:UDP-N-acetylmuramyl-tripeptide synthetase
MIAQDCLDKDEDFWQSSGLFSSGVSYLCFNHYDCQCLDPSRAIVVINGAKGQDHWNEILKHHPIAVISDAVPPNLITSKDTKIIHHPNPKKAISTLAKIIYPQQVCTQVAITGTNGKSSCVDILRQLCALMGQPSASMGTLGTWIQQPFISDGQVLDVSGLTTPDALYFHRRMHTLSLEYGINFLAFEASSHGLDQYRIHGANINAMGWTNFTHDHLDYHLTIEHYFESKLRLVKEILPPGAIGVIHRSCQYIDTIIHTLEKTKKKPVVVDSTPQPLYPHTLVYPKRIEINHNYTQIEFCIDGKVFAPIVFPLPGNFQIDNIVLCLGLLYSLGHDPTHLLACCERLKPIPGRMELVGVHRGASIFVDYAHTPDSLSTAISSLRPHTKAKLWVIFGCGGNRDAYKRPMMGSIASQMSDWVIITDDNSRLEDPSLIRKNIMDGCKKNNTNIKEIPDRGEAIGFALRHLEHGDCLLVAGKGHESYQDIMGIKHAFSDQDTIRLLMNK